MITLDKVELRYQFVSDYIHRKLNGLTVEQICSKYQICRKTLIKWVKRFLDFGKKGLRDRSKAPRNVFNKTPKQIEDQIVHIKVKNPKHGARRVWHTVKDKFRLCAATIHNIWTRRGTYELLKPPEEKPRFYEWGKPNELWHIDIASQKIKDEGTLYLVVVEDDYSRKCIACDVYRDKKGDRVVETLNRAFETYGRPDAMLSDNGKQFLSGDYKKCLGEIRDIKTRPRNPKCNGKVERLIRTIKEECIRPREFKSIQSFKHAVKGFVEYYNKKRKHMGIGDVVPDNRYY